MHVIRVFFFGDLRQIPLSPIGDLKNPSGMAGPRAYGPRARHAVWVFQIPDRAEGDLAKIPEEENPNNIHIFLLLITT